MGLVLLGKMSRQIPSQKEKDKEKKEEKNPPIELRRHVITGVFIGRAKVYPYPAHL